MFKRIASVAMLSAMGAEVFAASDLYRVAWTDDPATTATIGWRLLSGTDARVDYGTTADSTGWTSQAVDEVTSMNHPDDSQSFDTQLVRLTGLNPDTAYYFQVCDSEGCSDTRWFKTAPDAAQDFTFVAGGDSRRNSQPEETLARQIGNELVAAIRPLFILFNGDFTDDGTYAQWEEWLEDWQAAESDDGRVYPIIAAHGNHENDVVDMLSYVFGIPETGYYSLNVGGSMMEVFTLNSETEPGVGYAAYDSQSSDIWDQQTADLATDAAASDAIWKLGNYHRPMRPHTSSKSEGIGRIEAWASTFTDEGFDLIVESDTHMAKYTFPVVYSDDVGSYESFKRDDVNGTMLIGEGSWGAPTRPTDDDKPWTMDSASFWQFKLIHASETNLDIRTVRFGSENEQSAGTMLDPATVTALTQAEQDADAFAMPADLPVWEPLSGEVISLPASGFVGAEIDNVQLIGAGETWSYLDDGSSPNGWNTADFDASAWATGAAQLGYGDGDEATTVSFGADESNKHITTYFRKTVNVADASKVIKLTARMLRDDGAVLYINGEEAFRTNMPSGDITSTTPASNGIGGDAEETYYEYFILPELLATGDNVIAVEVHQSSGSSSDLSFDLDLTAVVSNIDETAVGSTTTMEAQALSISDIELSWNDDDAFDEVGYQLERKVAGGDWEILTWRIEAGTTSYTDSNLVEGGSYTYRITPFSSAGFSTISNEVVTATLSNAIPVVFSTDFELGEFGEFVTYSAASNSDWTVMDFDGNSYARMNGYGADEASDDWLISPSLPVGYYRNATLTFEAAYNFDGPLLGVKYSADYSGSGDPSTATWTTIPECADATDEFCWSEPAEGGYVFYPSAIDMSNIAASDVYIAFHYVSNGAASGDGRLWQVDNFTLRGVYAGTVIEGNDLANGIPAEWSNVSVASDANWASGSQLDIPGVFINGFGSDGPSEDWLIMPTTTIAESDMATLKFDYYQKYDGPALQIMVSTNYTDGDDPASADWTDLGVQMPDLYEAWQSVGPIDLSAYDGDINIAFVYTTTGTGPGDGAAMGVAGVEILSNLENVVQETTVVEEAFDAVDSLGQFTAVSVASDADWTIEERGSQIGAFANGFGADVASDDWLISPELQILNWQNGLIRFDVYTRYDGPALEVKVSNNFTGSGDPLADGVTWTTLDFDMSAAADDAWTTYELSVSSFTGVAYVAFQYTSIGTGPGESRILGVDNFEYLSTFGEEGLSGSFSSGATDYTTNQSVTFTPSISGGEAPYTYAWDFGDGNTSTDASPTHAYTAAGTYSITLTVTDANDETIELVRSDLISVVEAAEYQVPALAGDLRVAAFNAYLNRNNEGEILEDVLAGDDEQIQKVAEIIQRVRPDVILLNEFDYVADGSAVDALKQNYLEVAQDEDVEAIEYPYVFLAESNTGILTEYDFDNNGEAGSGGGDSYGFGEFPGQYAMVLLSRYPIVTDDVRTFQTFLWKDMPDAFLPVDPDSGESWFTDEELEVFRLSSKSHWDVPVEVNGEVVHILASHPTPPVFDGDEDRNGLRNHDEIRFWYDYVDPDNSDYIYDDAGVTGGLGSDKRFVIMGDLNASTDEGDATDDPIGLLFSSDYIDGSVEPTSEGGAENTPSSEFAATHTASWSMRADYVIPSTYGFEVEQTAVYWPTSADVNYDLVGPGVQSSDHRLVWLDASILVDAEPTPTPEPPPSEPIDESNGDDDDSWLGSFNYVFIVFAALLGLSRRLRITIK